MRPTPWRAALGAALLTAGASSGAAADEPPARPDVVLIVIDTARRDHFSAYGYDRPTTPAFAAFAEEGIRFDRAWSTSCWTVPSHASLFTGLYPSAHRANQETPKLPDDAVTLAEVLSDAGYETIAFSGNPWISKRGNLVQGFRRAELTGTARRAPAGTGLPHVASGRVRDALEGWGDAAAPIFLFVNLIEPHWPYEAPAAVQERFVPGAPVPMDHPAMFAMPRWYLKPDEVPRDLLPLRTAMYDADLAYADAILDELLRTLRELGRLDDALVIVTSDHGENHGEEGHVGHVFSLTEATLQVPLAIRLPRGERGGTVRDDPVQLVDVFPTVLGAVGLEPPPLPVRAYDLLSERAPEDRPVLAEYSVPLHAVENLMKRGAEAEQVRPLLRGLRSLRVGDRRVIVDSEGGSRLDDPAADGSESPAPGVQEDLERTLAELVAACEAAALAGEADTTAMDPDVEEQLRALGYIR
jgi:arylsulfatase A-like enzyme